MAHFLHHFCAWVIILIDSMAKTHKSKRIGLAFCSLKTFRNIFNSANFFQHFKHSFIGTTMPRSPESCYSWSNTGEWIRFRWTCNSNSRSRGILFMICMKHKYYINSSFNYRIAFKLLHWVSEHLKSYLKIQTNYHIEKVLDKRELFFGLL